MMMRKNRKQMVFIAILAVVMISLTGCSSLRAWVQDVPVWVIEKPSNTLTKIYFTGQGSDADGNEMTARQAAQQGLLDEISEFLGYDVHDLYKRELLQSQALGELDLTITKEFQKVENGILTIHLLAEANRKTISTLVRANLDNIRADESKIDAPESEAKASYKRQDDYNAFRLYLKAAAEAYQSPLAASKARYEGLMDEAISVLMGLNFQLTDTDDMQGSFHARVTRGTGIFAPKIVSFPVKAVFPVKNAAGNVRQEELKQSTDTKGLVSFTPSHTNFRGSGTFTMYFDLSEIVEELSDTVGADDVYVTEMRKIIVDKRLEVPFSITSEVAGSVIVASMLDYSKNGTLLTATASLDSLIEMLQQDGIYANRIDPNNDLGTESKVLQFARANFADTRSIAVIGSAGVHSVVESGDRYVASIKGSARVYSLKDGSLYAQTGEFAANGVGLTSDLAVTAAFKRFGQVAASLVIGKLL
ncbi:MAG: hypothetical protein K9L73_04530 [Spirochaetia bacterium]|nr:hypothetical protein [Spirochaetia bacterium]